MKQRKGKKVGVKWTTARSNRSSWSVHPAGGIFWSSETMWGTGNTVFYSEWDKTLISDDRIKQGIIKLDTKMYFFVPAYLLSLLNMCIDYVNVVCLKMCSHYSLGLWVSCWYLQYCIACRPTNWLISFLKHFLSFLYSGKSLTNSGHAKASKGTVGPKMKTMCCVACL